jgi:hypothetical protein
MDRHPTSARRVRGVQTALVLLALSCQSLLGMDELSTAPRETTAEPTGNAGASRRGTPIAEISGTAVVTLS